MPTITTENSFCTIAEADDILDNFHAGTSWAALDDNIKARLLITATRILRMVYGVQVEGAEAAVLKNAAAFQAVFMHQHGDLVENVIGAGIAHATSETLGSMARARAKAGFDIEDAVSPYVRPLFPAQTIELMRG
ncbi:hypothetical protein [Pseudodesulfovibrio senegalensis]|uniref:Uncharacterized protein n=1 Tax=Pseudodesulfovibrio senegalensis TaxID=1721087 RepID=A0A6N6N6H2_9BACT|nr:hypothetical protein [Pseudodesulfovibrio senegalensis]KAB1443079.1 hypothetical protein F8A88_02100 [Pseudodesulfovibrio senegalensis]